MPRISTSGSIDTRDRQRTSPREYLSSKNQSTYDNLFLNDVLSKRLSEVAAIESLSAAAALKQTLSDNTLNVVTAESLTAGMIAKTLVDLPGQGAVIYGGFVVYDTDAKRKFIDVNTKGVYSILTAQQMAAGALEKSRAMVAISVSGDAMPYPESKFELGYVYIGVALRLSDRILIEGKQIALCDNKDVRKMCDGWKELNRPGPDPKYAPFQYTAALADYIRMKTVAEACSFAKTVIDDAIVNRVKWGTVQRESYDSICNASWILEKNIYPPPQSPSRGCDPHDTSSVF
jgi:nicotinamide-nucleotide amidase